MATTTTTQTQPFATVPSTRTVAITESEHKITIKTDDPIPTATGKQVLIKIEASGICATDLHLVRRSIPYLTRTVDICGHEGVGRIVQLGPHTDSQKWKVGDRVSHRWIYRVCGQCEMCQGDHEQLCEKRVLSGKDVDGCWAGESEVRRWVAEHQSINSVYGASDHTLVDSEYLLPIPEDVDAAEVAPILCAGNISGERLMFQQSLMAVQERPSTVL